MVPFCGKCFFLKRQGTADASSPLKGKAYEVGTATYNSLHLNNEA